LAFVGKRTANDYEQALLDMAAECRQLVQEVRRICDGLYPDGLDLVGLPASLERVMDCRRSSGGQGSVYCTPSAQRRFAEEVEGVIFRACLQTLADGRFRGAREASILLDHKEGILRLSVIVRDFPAESGPVGEVETEGTVASEIEAMGGWMRTALGGGQVRVDMEVPSDVAPSASLQDGRVYGSGADRIDDDR